MKQLVVAGSEEFTLGFRLAGVHRIVNATGEEDIIKLTEDAAIGILVLEDTLFKSFDADTQVALESRIQPVTVVIGTEDTGEGLKQLIKKSIGVEME